MSPASQTNPATPLPAPTEGRDASGRFAKGNPGGLGNPNHRRSAALRQAMLDCVTDEDIQAVIKAVIDQAKEGNIAAAKLFFQYVFGKPGPVDDMGRNETAGMGLSPWPFAATPTSPAAPKANGSNGSAPTKGNEAPKPKFSRESEIWLDRELYRVTEAVSKQPLANGV
jgi:hypothetical protein